MGYMFIILFDIDTKKQQRQYENYEVLVILWLVLHNLSMLILYFFLLESTSKRIVKKNVKKIKKLKKKNK